MSRTRCMGASPRNLTTSTWWRGASRTHRSIGAQGPEPRRQGCNRYVFGVWRWRWMRRPAAGLQRLRCEAHAQARAGNNPNVKKLVSCARTEHIANIVQIEAGPFAPKLAESKRKSNAAHRNLKAGSEVKRVRRRLCHESVPRKRRPIGHKRPCMANVSHA